jgi:hypothetical protein
MAGFNVQMDSVSAISIDTTTNLTWTDVVPSKAVKKMLWVVLVTAITGTWDFRLRYNVLNGIGEIASRTGVTTLGTFFLSPSSGIGLLEGGGAWPTENLQFFWDNTAAGSITATLRAVVVTE